MTNLTPENMRLMREGIRDWIIRDPETGECERLEDRVRRVFDKPEEWARIFNRPALKEGL